MKLLMLAGAAAGMIAAGAPAQAQDDPISIYFVGCAAPTGFHGYLARGSAEAGEKAYTAAAGGIMGVGATAITMGVYVLLDPPAPAGRATVVGVALRF